jgi:Ca2+-binding RTX toxin-like protein
MNAFRRIALGVALTGAAACAVPAIASADSTCTYTSSVREVDIADNSGVAPLSVVRTADNFIKVADGGGVPHFCLNPQATTLATVDNTDTIAISGPVPGAGDGYVLDQSGGPLKSAAGKQIKTIGFSSGTNLPDLTVIGTKDPDKIRIGANGFVDLNGDGTSDFSNTGGAHEVDVFGGGGRDSISGRGFGSVGGSTVQLALDGGDDKDALTGGTAHDALTGGAGDDTIVSSDLTADRLEGDGGFDTVVYDKRDLFADVFENPILDHSAPVAR